MIDWHIYNESIIAELHEKMDAAYAKCAAEESSTGEQLVEAVKSAIDTEARYKRALIEKLVQDCIKLKFSLPEIRRRLNRDFKDIIQEDNETYAPRFRISTMIKEATNRK